MESYQKGGRNAEVSKTRTKAEAETKPATAKTETADSEIVKYFGE